MMTSKRRKRDTRKRVKINSYNTKKPLRKRMKFFSRKPESSFDEFSTIENYQNNRRCQIANETAEDDDDRDRPKLPYKKPKQLQVREKGYKNNDNEGKCRFQETHSSSEEEEAGIRRTQKVIDEEKKENRKQANKREVPENNGDSAAKTKKAIEKHARKVKNKPSRKKKVSGKCRCTRK